jgi:hypothetical protein
LVIATGKSKVTLQELRNWLVALAVYNLPPQQPVLFYESKREMNLNKLLEEEDFFFFSERETRNGCGLVIGL